MSAESTLLEMLLQEQQKLSAVDAFSMWLEDSPATVSRYQALMPTQSLNAGQQYAFEVNLDTCSGCKACVVACHNLNGLEESETWRKVGLLTSKSLALPIVQHVTTACHHCVDPGCLNGCPVLAYEKDPITGIVKHLDDQCFGCQYCTMMCPYEVPQYSQTLGIVRKCDMCSQRLSNDEAPACVQACPNQAIRITIVDQEKIILESDNNQTLSLVVSAPPSGITIPTTRYVSSRGGATSSSVLEESVQEPSEFVSSPTLIDTPQHGHWPLALMLVMTQASVGMYCCLAMSAWFPNLFLNSRNIDNTLPLSIVASLVGIGGVHLALLHLGRPMYAFRAFLGWRTSWLSREAILFGLYMGAMVSSSASLLLASTSWFVDILPPYMPKVLIGSTALIGLVSVSSSAMIYIATRRSLWSARRTMWDFGATTLGLGLAGSHLFVASHSTSIITISTSTFFMLTGLLVTMASGWLKVRDWFAGTRPLTSWKDFSARSGRLLGNALRRFWYAQWICYAIAFGLIVWASMTQGQSVSFAIGIVFCLILLVAKFICRWLYFASVVTYRMPGA